MGCRVQVLLLGEPPPLLSHHHLPQNSHHTLDLSAESPRGHLLFIHFHRGWVTPQNTDV